MAASRQLILDVQRHRIQASSTWWASSIHGGALLTEYHRPDHRQETHSEGEPRPASIL
jgi:hypothetical protein